LKVLLIHRNTIPVFAYGGTERVVWDLGRALVELGHSVTFLVHKGSRCDFANIVEINESEPLFDQIEKLDFDIAHFQFNIDSEPNFPYLMTEHGNSKTPKELPLNTVFISQDHAQRYNGSTFVHNGLDWRSYGTPKLKNPRETYHFLGHGAWRVKNLRGAIQVALSAGEQLEVLGGHRFNFTRGIRLTFSPRIHFHGMVGGQKKLELLEGSKGLIFPVRWHEPFGLAIIESLYMGAPVFGTPFGALPEIVSPACGLLAHTGRELVEGILSNRFDPLDCHERAKNEFNHIKMGESYAHLYTKVIQGGTLQKQAPLLRENGHQLLKWSM
jgi:glycosyltransferase involved in cell wall biosynthesis